MALFVLSGVQKIQSLAPAECVLERNISELKVSMDKLMTGQVAYVHVDLCERVSQKLDKMSLFFNICVAVAAL